MSSFKVYLATPNIFFMESAYFTVSPSAKAAALAAHVMKRPVNFFRSFQLFTNVL
jgi:hypothetical protein